MLDLQRKLYLLDNHVKPDVDVVEKYTASLRITYGIRFAYAIIFKGTHYYLLFDDFVLIKKIIDHLEYGHLFCQEEITGFRNDGFRIVSWPKIPLSDNMLIYSETGLGNGITIFRTDIDYIEMWAFMSQNFEDRQAWLITHKDFCVEYARGFNNILATLHAPRKFMPNDLFFLSKGFEPIDVAVYMAEHERMKATLNEAQQHGLYLEKNNQLIRITPRELEICSKMSRVYNAKTIAHELNISPRVVEKHLENVRVKTSACSKSDILSLCHNKRYLV